MRERHRRFADKFLEVIPTPEAGPFAMKQAMIEAAKAGFSATRGLGARSDEEFYELAERTLSNGQVHDYIRMVYEQEADFRQREALAIHAQHIRGGIEVERVAIGKDGSEIRYTEKLAPNYQALKDYLSMTMPKPVKKVEVDQRTAVVRVNVNGEPPKMRARVLDVAAKPSLD